MGSQTSAASRVGGDHLRLADAIIAPTAAEDGAQMAVWQTLSAHCAALARQSMTEIAEDETLGLHPPPLPQPVP
jgi:hypothetical protein